jgi:hypothetical protein
MGLKISSPRWILKAEHTQEWKIWYELQKDQIQDFFVIPVNKSNGALIS